MKKAKIVVVVGPTASGKSDLAVEIAKKFDGEVISADSRQVYRGLDIGTGKITEEEMGGIPHHLLDVADPEDQFSVADFKQLAEGAVQGILEQKKLPIIAGGTGYYIKTLVDGFTPPEVPPNEALRAELREKSAEELFKILEEKDPDRAEVIDRDNPRRLVRAIEIAEALGKVPPEKINSRYDSLQIGIGVEKETLRERINTRLRKRIDEGMIEEAKRLHENGLSYGRMEELGLEYRYLARYLQNTLSPEEMIKELQNKIWQYAKRQLTWLRRDKRIKWFSLEEKEKIFHEIEKFLTE